MKKGRKKQLSRTASHRRSAAYWRTRFEQLQSDFDELLAVNQVLSRHIDEIEGGNFIAYISPYSQQHHLLMSRNPTTDLTPRLVSRQITSSSDKEGLYRF